MIIKDLKEKGYLVYQEKYPHVYPHCWRSGDELVFRIVDDHPYPYDKAYIYYSRDQWGLRGESFKNPSDVKMLTVGGSTTDQRYITEGETWQDVMATTLKDSGIDFDAEMQRIQKDFKTLLIKEKDSQNQLINAFKVLGYEL